MSLMDTVFGGGIEQIEKDREAKKQANIQAILNQRQKDGNYDALGAFGTQLGTKLGDKFSKKIFGDPEMDQAKADQLAVEQIRSQYEPSDPRFGYALSDLFRQRGDMKTSISLFNQAQKQEKQIEKEQKQIQEASEDVARNKQFAESSNSSVVKGLVKNDPNIPLKDLQAALTQEQSTKKDGSVVVNGKPYPAFTKGGRLFSVDPKSGEIVDISTSGLTFEPFSTSVNNTTINTGDANKNRYADAFFKTRAEKDVATQVQKANAASTARKTLSLAETSLEFLENTNVNSGVGAETIAQFKGFLGTVLAEAGINIDNNKFLNIKDESTLNAFTTEYLKPYVEAQGRSFSDADLKLSLKNAVSLKNTREANKFIANVSKLSALNTQENSDFYNERFNQVGEGGKEKFASLTNSDRDFGYYVNDLPRFKTLSDGNFEVINDGRDLHKYWQGGRPETFTIDTADGANEYTFETLKTISKEKGKTVREVLADFDRKGLIMGWKSKTNKKGSKK